MYIDKDKCIACELCIDACALGIISEENGEIIFGEDCPNSRACPAATVCPHDAIIHHKKNPKEGTVVCTICPVHCEIPPGGTGDCQMMTNRNGEIVRRTKLTSFDDVKQYLKVEYNPIICKPLITGIGAGTHCINPPAPYIVQDKVEGVDVVTSVTECHYLFAGINVKIDAEKYIGEEGSGVFYNGKEVGMVGKEQYGSKYLELGNINTFTNGNDGWKAAKAVAEIANRKRIKLDIQDGPSIEVQVGESPIIDGEISERRRYGCGGEVAVSLARVFMKDLYERGIVNEGIVIDRGYTGRFGEPETDFTLDPWRKPIMKSGIKIHYVKPSLFCLPHDGGKGWGMTPLESGFDIIDYFDTEKIDTGYTLLVTEPSADRVAFYEFTKDKKFKEISLPSEVKEVIDEFKRNCEPARVSAYFIAGAGGTARKGVTQKPLQLSKAVLDRKARVTVGGAPTLVFTGGGINFMVDVEEVKPGAFYWTPAPAVVAPLEFTLTAEDYKGIGGFLENVMPLKKVLDRGSKK